MSQTIKEDLYVETYFPTLIYYKDLSEGRQQNRLWEEQIYDWRERDAEGIERSNIKRMGAWHSQTDMQRQDAYKSMREMLLSFSNEVANNLGYTKARDILIDNMWANINPPMGYNRSHTHPGCLLSGVYYIKVPEDNPGKIIFKDPRVQADMLRPQYDPDRAEEQHRWSEVRFAPKEGRAILFPSWLSHEVEANMSEANGSDADRISVAFNLYQGRLDSSE